MYISARRFTNMADEITEKHYKKRRSHLGMVFWETWKETEMHGVVIEDLAGGIMTVLLAIVFQVVKWDEFLELIFLAIVGGACGVILGFIYRFAFVTPTKIYRELEDKFEVAESKLSELQTVKSLEVGALPPKQMLDRPRSVYACEIFIRNDNQATSGVKLKLLGISPAFQTRDASIAIEIRII